MVVECVVLLGVEHFQQRRGRIAAEVHRHLVDLVQHEQRVLAADLVEVLHDAARHRTDIGTTVATDLGFVAHAAQRHAHELAVGGLGDGLAQRSLAHARRADQTQDRALHLLHPRLHRQVFKDALLDLLQAVVIGIEGVLRGLQVLAHLAALLPRHAQQPLQVVAHDRCFGGHRRHLLELVEFVARLGFHRLGHARFGDLAGQLFQFARRVVEVAQFLLDGLHLFVEVVLALALFHLRLHAAADALFHLLHVDLAVDQTDQHLQAFAHGQRFQQALLVRQPHADMRGDGVGKAGRLIDAGQGLQQLRRQLAVGLDVLLEQRHQRAGDRLDLARLACIGGIDFHGLAVQRSIAFADAGHLHARQAFDQHLDGAVGQLQQLQHLRQGADLVEVGGLRVIGLGRLLRQQQDALVRFHCLFQRMHGLVAADEQRDDHVREYHYVAQRQDRQVEGLTWGTGHGGSREGENRLREGIFRRQKKPMAPLWGHRLSDARRSEKILSIQQVERIIRRQRPSVQEPVGSGRSGTARTCARSPIHPRQPC
ncbi:hypothetical protein D3C81_884380 [compost metagenome]